MPRYLFWILLFTSPLVFSQVEDYRFTHIGKENGLPNRVVTGIAQDSQGFMWFTTQNGLCRYDGYQFKVFRHSPSDTNSITHDRAFSLFKDSRGMLWIGTEGGGVDMLNPSTEKFIHYRHSESNENTICDNEIYAIGEDADGLMYFGGKNNGLSILDVATGKFNNLTNSGAKPSMYPGQIWAIFRDSQNDMWISVWGSGLVRYRPSDKSKTVYHPSTDGSPGLSSGLPGVIQEKDGKLWIATWGGGLDIFDKKNETWQSLSHDHHNLNSIASNDLWPIIGDDLGNFWIGSYGEGLIKYNSKTKRFITYGHDPVSQGPVSGLNIWSLFIDRSGILWVGTDGGGITKVVPNDKKFKHFAHTSADSTSLSQSKVKPVLIDKRGQLWVGCWGQYGLNKYDSTSGGFTKYHIHLDKKDSNVVSDKLSVIKDKVGVLLEDSKGRFWTGTYRGGIYLFDRSIEKYVLNIRTTIKEDKLTNNHVTDMVEDDKTGSFWIATYRGLNKMNGETFEIEQFTHSKEDHSISNDEINDLHYDAEGVLWVCTNNGLNYWTDESKGFESLHSGCLDGNCLPHSSVNCIHQGKDGIYWIGTKNGLSRYDRDKQRFTNYSDKDGLCNNVINGLLGDDQGNLWISTNYGLSRFDPAEKKFVNYDKRDGIQGYEYVPGAFYKDPKGNLYFGGHNGFNSFDPQQIRDNPHAPPVAITSVKIMNEELIGDSVIHQLDTIVLTYKQKDIAFEYAALDFMIPEKNQFSYQLVGYDPDSSKAIERHFMSYTNLSPGTYTFKVWGSNNDRLWNREPAQLVIIISPPFWETTWFYVLQSLFFIALLGFSIYYNRSNAHTGIAKVLAFLSVFMVFEYIFVLIEPYIDQISQGAAFFKVLLNLVLALSILPIEKLIERRFIKDQDKK